MRKTAFVAMTLLIGLSLAQSGCMSNAAPPGTASGEVSDQLRAELFAARELTWRAFFTEDPSRLEQLLGPELIAIQQHQEQWEARDELVEMARAIQRDRIRVERLEFPRTEISRSSQAPRT